MYDIPCELSFEEVKELGRRELILKKYATMEGENVIAERIKYMITLGIDTANQTLAIGVYLYESFFVFTNRSRY